MVAKILLLCGTIGLVEADLHSRYPGYQDHKQRPQDHRTLTYPHPSSLPEEYWGRGLIRKETFNPTSATDDTKDYYDAENHQTRNENWCSSTQSRLVTYIAACKTEKYVIKSQQPCPNGTPDCQKIMYRAALKPIYQVKQKVINPLQWKCCPGYFGKNCEYHDPNFLLVSTTQPASWEEEQEAFSSQRDITEAHQSHEALLEDLQNDFHQATNNLGVLQKVLHYNTSSTQGEMNHSQSEVHEQFLQQMLFPHVESFLREHLNPVWASFNKSLQDLSATLKNLSQNVEANRKRIEGFKENIVPKKDFQELGTKFESKVQANVLRVDQMKHEIDSHLHLQQAAIHYNLTMIKADTDLKLKRHHKIQHLYLLALNNSIADLRQQQNKLQDELETLNRNLAPSPIQFGSQNEAFTERDIQILNQSLARHAQQLARLYDEAEEDYQILTDSIKNLKANSKREIEEFRVELMEMSLTIEDYREDLERKILALNNTLSNIQEGHRDLQKSLKGCHCEKLPPSGTDMEDQANITQINREEMKQLEARLKDLAAAFPLIYQSLDFQQEQSRKLEGGMSLLKSHTERLSENIGILNKNDEKMHGHIKYLNSSFHSLLVDAMRHEIALEALLGEEIMEVLSEDLEPSTLLSPIQQLQVTVRIISDNLTEQNITLESLMKRIHSLERLDRENNPNVHKPLKHPVVEKQIEDAMQEVTTQRSRVEHMEPNHEASVEDVLDNPAYHDIMTLKKEIGHLSREMKKYELQRDYAAFCCNHTIDSLVEPLSVSVKNLREDLASAQQGFEEHLQVFQMLFGSNKELAAVNLSLDVSKIQSLMGRRMRKQLQVQEGQKLRDKKEANNRREGTLNGRNKIHTEILETGTTVAFYVRYSEGREAPSLNETYLNYGGGYFPEHGYFKSPHSGVYMVAINVELVPGPALGQLVFSSRQRMTLISNKKKKATGGSMTTFALVELKKGEHMWFELVQGAGTKQNPAGLSLAGFLIFKT
ncbi:multimerin-2 [Rhineura floridana]|uniref:multimerin-2 n=1 Tax=Rhineura floridana TaxID=261503 RepID=UPI002AC83F62|nr:multimerin-2 [Rhineura floridana]